MFINCRHCNALVATHPVTDAPPERCPHCAGWLAAGAAGDATNSASAATEPSPEDPTTPPAQDADAAWHRAADLLSTPTSATAPAAPTANPVAPLPPAAVVPPLLPLQHAIGAPVAAGVPQAGTVEATPLGDLDAAPGSPPECAPLPEAEAETETEIETKPEREREPDANVTAVSEDAPVVAPAHRATQHPSFVATRDAMVRHAARHRWWMPATIVALSLLLLLQILLADRARLAMDAGWRPLLSALCGVAACALPPWREPGAFSLLARDVRPDPARPGLLRASATFRNDARWAQAWPAVVLTLSDVEGRAIGRRAFAPHEYLGDMPTQDTLASEQSAMIRLEIVEPAANVVAFSFHFE